MKENIIETYRPEYKDKVISLILEIQQEEFNVPVKLEDLPDLQNIEEYYFVRDGKFWVATDHKEVVGTIAVIDIGHNQFALRKMFVAKDYRGRERGIAQMLLDEVIRWARLKGVTTIYLGTIDFFLAAQKFYLKNGFIEIQASSLPQHFPKMKVDNRFFMLDLENKL
ncbi:MAG: GNAT family N-acetyltransferase [Chitinophagaceae bacterium]|nr:GNAT family N-acetyltransferase [Chitinophagaceae bacterium]